MTKRTKPYVWVPDDGDLAPATRMVYGGLAAVLGETNRPTHAKIADRCGMSVRSVVHHMKLLEDVGLVTVVRSGRGPHAYELPNYPEPDQLVRS